MRKKLEDQPADAETTQPLHVKYRPKNLGDVLGQDATVKSLLAMLKAKARPHTFLFTGPAGTGKTTLARILASDFGVTADGLVEVDAASNSGIDDMRGLTQALRYNGFGASGKKAIILDECQGLSKQAWDSLLKWTEEPPDHVYFFFCSTAPAKIPAAMVTRCAAYNLQSVRRDDILDVLEFVCEAEGLDPVKGALRRVADACEGSVRAALTMLAKVAPCDDIGEVQDLLDQPDENAEVIDLCRLLVAGKLTWAKLQPVAASMADTPAESVRIVVTAYVTKCLLGAKSEKDVGYFLDVLDAFKGPYPSTDRLAPVLLSFGRFLGL